MIIKQNILVLNENDLCNIVSPIIMLCTELDEVNNLDIIKILKEGFEETKWLKGFSDTEYESIQIMLE